MAPFKLVPMFFNFEGAQCLWPVLSFQGLSLGLSVSDIILVNGLATCLSLPSSPITGKSHLTRVFLITWKFSIFSKELDKLIRAVHTIAELNLTN